MKTLWEKEKMLVLPKTNSTFSGQFDLLSANAFNLDQSENLSSGKEFNDKDHHLTTLYWVPASVSTYISLEFCHEESTLECFVIFMPLHRKMGGHTVLPLSVHLSVCLSVCTNLM